VTGRNAVSRSLSPVFRSLPSRFVIFNADDFGRSEAINRAVIRAHRDGVLTSASLMVGEPQWRQAVRFAHECPELGVGLHLTLSEGVPVLGKNELGSLRQSNGRLASSLFRAGIRLTFSAKARTAMGVEMDAQFARFAETGLPFSHVDGHQHFHLHPVLWDKMLALCVQYGVKCVRLPHEECRAHFRNGGQGVTLDTVAALFLRVLVRRHRRKLHEHNLFAADRVYGMLQTANMNVEYLLRLLPRLQGQTVEIYAHPGSEYAARLPHPSNGVNDVELAALIDPRLRETLERLGIVRGTYRQAREQAITSA
jgi:chitin disaccharide deacetylase